MEGKQETLLQGDQPSKLTLVSKWYFVTNHLNLFYMLGTGLLMSPSGFGDKYYQDTLNCFPGWLPLFPDKVPKAAIETSVQEQKHLIPCILEVDLGSLQGPVMAIDQQGKVTQPRYPDGLTGSETVLLLPAPLPTTWITAVIFYSKVHKDNCIKDASDFGNVGLSVTKLKVARDHLFGKNASNLQWPQQSDEVPQREVPLEKPLATGAILAMLTHLANSSDLAIDAAKLAFDGSALGADKEYKIISAMSEWMQGNGLGEDRGQSAQIYWNLVESMVQARTNQEVSTPLDVVLSELEKIRDNLDEEAKQGFESLVGDLKGINGLGGQTITELFKSHPRPLPRSLLMFFLRESCSEFLDFRHDLLSEYDYVLAAILFGAREKWLGLPTSLRNMPGLKEACCHRMAVMSHQLAKTSMDLGTAPDKPESLRELFKEHPWSKRQQEAATLLSRESGWDCIHTRVTIGKGKYKLEVDGTGVHLILNGEPKAVRTEADYDAVLQKLASESIPAKVDSKVRTLLKGKPI